MPASRRLSRQTDAIESTAETPVGPTIRAEVPNSPFTVILRPMESDIAAYRQAFVARIYDHPALPIEASAIVDLSPQIGLGSLFYAAKYPSARFVCAGPDDDDFGLLRRNLAQLGSNALALAEQTMPRLAELGLTHVDILKLGADRTQSFFVEGDDLAWLAMVDVIVIEPKEIAQTVVDRLVGFGFHLETAADAGVDVWARDKSREPALLPAPASIAARSKPLDIAVTRFWQGFSLDRGFVKHLLDLSFDQWRPCASPAEADLVLTSVFPHAVAEFPAKTLAFIWENVRPNYRCYAYSFSSDLDHYNQRNVRLPMWFADLAWSADLQRWGTGGNGCHGHEPLLQVSALAMPRPGRFIRGKQFCAYVASNPEPYRMMAADALSSIQPVEAFGPVAGRVEQRSKYDILHDFAFSMCFENSLFPGYHTEKLLQAWAAGSVPLYFGDRSVAGDFNPEAFLNRSDYSTMDAFVEEVGRIFADPDALETIWRRPLLREAPSLAAAVAFLRTTARAIQHG